MKYVTYFEQLPYLLVSYCLPTPDTFAKEQKRDSVKLHISACLAIMRLSKHASVAFYKCLLLCRSIRMKQSDTVYLFSTNTHAYHALLRFSCTSVARVCATKKQKKKKEKKKEKKHHSITVSQRGVHSLTAKDACRGSSLDRHV